MINSTISDPDAKMSELPPELHFTLKVISRCNLNCSYCYVYHKADQSWKNQPAVMSDEVFMASIARIKRHCEASKQASVRIVLHGGEPLMLGKKRFIQWCRFIQKALSPHVKVIMSLQTNGTLIDSEWAEIFAAFGIGVGISIDGSQKWHDMYRVDHFGEGSYDNVCKGVTAVTNAEIRTAFLTVINFDSDPQREFEHLLSFNPDSIDFIFPDQNHTDIHHIRAKYGPTPCADYLIPIFDMWLDGHHKLLDISPFTAMLRAVLGNPANVDFIGNKPYRYMFIEADGTIEGLDVLKTCGENLSKTGLNIFDNDFMEVQQAGSLHKQSIFDGMPLPKACESCLEKDSCAGGYLPHRYNGSDFLSRSAWCADLYKLFSHIRFRLGLQNDDPEMKAPPAYYKINEGVQPCV